MTTILRCMAQVGAHEQQAAQRDRQRLPHLDATVAEAAGPVAAQEALAADGIDQDATLDAAGGGAEHCLDDLVGLAADVPDVELQVAGVPGGVDVGDEGRERLAGVAEEADFVAGQRRAVQHRFAQAGQPAGAGRQLRGDDLARLPGRLDPAAVRVVQRLGPPVPVRGPAATRR